MYLLCRTLMNYGLVVSEFIPKRVERGVGFVGCFTGKEKEEKKKNFFFLFAFLYYALLSFVFFFIFFLVCIAIEVINPPMTFILSSFFSSFNLQYI